MSDLWLANQREFLERCPVCNSGSRTLVHRALTDKLFHCSEDRWDLYGCEACGTHYLDPRPNKESIGRAYVKYLTHQAPAAAVQPASGDSARDAAKDIMRALANGYRNARWGTRLEPQLPLGRYLIPCVPLLRGALVQQLRSLPGHPGPGARLLDVGCGNGAFLQLARSAGWSVQGIDFDGAAVAAARSLGLDVQQGGLELLQAAESKSFAWVSFSHVLEHVHDPVSWLQGLYRLIHPGGTLWLQTPNIGSIGHARYAENWRDLDPPRHLTLWNQETLCQTLKQLGFRNLRPLRTPVLTAMEVYASSQALRLGMDYTGFTALPGGQRRHMRYLWPALRQHWSLRHSEFLTLIANR